jgi:hypothetical protein
MFYLEPVDRDMRHPYRARQGWVSWNTRGVAPGWDAMPRQGIQRLSWMSVVSVTTGTDDFGHAPFMNLCAFLWLKITSGIQQDTFAASIFQNALS